MHPVLFLKGLIKDSKQSAFYHPDYFLLSGEFSNCLPMVLLVICKHSFLINLSRKFSVFALRCSFSYFKIYEIGCIFKWVCTFNIFSLIKLNKSLGQFLMKCIFEFAKLPLSTNTNNSLQKKIAEPIIDWYYWFYIYTGAIDSYCL